MEQWKPVNNTKGLYEVSTCGRVRRANYRNLGYPRLLKLCHNKYGYSYVSLSIDGKIRQGMVHRLVAEAFIPNPENKPQVNHIDEDKTNNHADNLEWSTAKENINHGTSLQRRAHKQRNDKRSKPVKQLDMNGNVINIWPSAKEASRAGYDTSHIGRCCRGIYQQYKSYKWEYL